MTFRSVLLAAALSALAGMASAADVTLSGFASLGFAQSDQGFNYQRFINKQGTFKRDSLIGAQMDARLGDEWGLTIQGKLAPSMARESGFDPTVTWAFLSWRPTNDWLVRVGRLRIPVYLHSENMDVGATFDFARLPAEVYASVQTTDGDGLFVGKTWNIDDYELTLNGYYATAKMDYRYYLRESIPTLYGAGPLYVPVTATAGGLVATLQRDENVLRVSAHEIYNKITNDQLLAADYPYVAMFPGVGYYQISNLVPGPGVRFERDIRAMAYTFGADVTLGNGYRVMGEYVLRRIPNVLTAPDSQGGYLSVLRQFGAWTPYLSVARLVSRPATRDLYNNINSNRIPGYIPGASLINASQRGGADGINAYDQTTWSIGTSYRLNPTSKIKAEWAHTRTGDMTQFIDAPPGGESGKQVVNVFSLSYSVVF